MIVTVTLSIEEFERELYAAQVSGFKFWNPFLNIAGDTIVYGHKGRETAMIVMTADVDNAWMYQV